MRKSLCLPLCFFFVLVAGCGGGDPGEEGGLIGTGLIGTVSETKVLASESVELKSTSGEKSTASLNRNRRFAASNLAGDAPYLVRSDLGNGDYRYAIAYQTGTARNVHSYSDVILRYWFQVNGIDLDATFNSSEPVFSLPTQQEYDQLSASLFSTVALVLGQYDVTGPQLLTAIYNADDRGIDRYLDNNPVVLEDGQLKILLTDPTTDIQAETTANLTFDSTISADGVITSGGNTSSPTRVGNVRALGSRLDEIVVVWSPATDDIGVVGYQVLQDGALIATTPFPVYTDTNLQAGSFYSYEIVAIDSSGNRSPDSIPVVGQTLSSVDNAAPPAPTSVNDLERSPSRVVLQWSQADISDVVAFNVYRGAPGETLELLLRSTSNGVTDASVSGGTEYCYRIQAVDASGNQSELSDIFCLDTSGSSVGQTTTEVIGGMDIPDVDDIACVVTLPAAITEDTNLAESCYLVNSDTEILSSADVTVAAGTVFKFAQGVGLDVTTNASLSIIGTADNPVIFTGQEKRRGHWRGITYDRTENTENAVVNAVIEYAGAGQAAALSVISRDSPRSRLRVQNSLFRFNFWTGVSLGGASIRLDAFDGNVMTENRQPAFISPLLLGQLGANNDFSGAEGNEFDVIVVPRLGISEDFIIPNLGVPLQSFGIALTTATMTVDAGVEIMFDPGVEFTFDQGANLIVNGTAENPVLFTAREKSPGGWGGVQLMDSPASKLEGVIIEFGGQAIGQHNANLSLVNSVASLKDVILRDSSGYGYFADDDSDVIDLGNVQQINNVLQ